MKIAVFSAKRYDKQYLDAALASRSQQQTHQFTFHEFALSNDTVSLAKGCEGVCVFVNDALPAPVIESLHSFGIKAILLRCAGYNNVDLRKAEELGIFVANVPAYSPEAVAEFAVALIQTLNRKTHRAYNRVREGNFNLDGLLGRTLHGQTVGLIGTGRIGIAFAKIMHGFGCRLIAYDVFENDQFRNLGEYVGLDELLQQSDIVSLHCPLMDNTKHIVNEASLAKMKKGAVLVNTSRGGLVDTKAVINALKSSHLGGLAMDVYEAEGSLFYNDHSGEIIKDDDFMRLMTFHNVLACGHQAFFTEEALREISDVTLSNLEDFSNGRECKNSLIKGIKGLSRVGSLPVRI
jgi:D-lactate dehydrogenase